MGLRLVTGPTVEPVSLEEAKLHLRVDITEDDYLIQWLIQAARETAEDISGWRLCTQTWDYYLDEFPSGSELALPNPPLVSVTSISYTLEGAGVASTFAAASYQVDAVSVPGRVLLRSAYSWPADVLEPANGVVVRFVCGFGTPEAVPQQIRQAMFLMLGHWYENREAIVSSGAVPKELPLGVSALLWMRRVKGF